MNSTASSAEHFIFVTQLHFAAMYAVVAWDWLLALPREWRFIWKTNWTPVKFAYLFCRYWVLGVGPILLWAFITDHELETCRRIYKIPVALAMWNQAAAEAILLIRTYAFFNRNNYILALLVSAFGGVVAYQLYVATSEMLLLPFVLSPVCLFNPRIPTMTGGPTRQKEVVLNKYTMHWIIYPAVFVLWCLGQFIGYFLRFFSMSFCHAWNAKLLKYATIQSVLLTRRSAPVFPCQSRDLRIYLIAPLLYDTMVTIMTVGKAIMMRRRGGGPNSRLIQTFIREGVFYYLLISVANLINGVFYLQPHQDMSAICIPLSVMLAPILACHLILDLRERGSETVAQSAGTIAFTAGVTASSRSNIGSPFSGLGFGFGTPSSSKAIMRPTGVLLSTMGSIPMEGMGIAMTSGLELDNLQAYESEGSVEKDVEMGLESTVSGIRVEVEKTTM